MKSDFLANACDYSFTHLKAFISKPAAKIIVQMTPLSCDQSNKNKICKNWSQKRGGLWPTTLNKVSKNWSQVVFGA